MSVTQNLLPILIQQFTTFHEDPIIQIIKSMRRSPIHKRGRTQVYRRFVRSINKSRGDQENGSTYYNRHKKPFHVKFTPYLSSYDLNFLRRNMLFCPFNPAKKFRELPPLKFDIFFSK